MLWLTLILFEKNEVERLRIEPRTFKFEMQNLLTQKNNNNSKKRLDRFYRAYRITLPFLANINA